MASSTLSYCAVASLSHLQLSSISPLHKPLSFKPSENLKTSTLRFSSVKIKATIDGGGQFSTIPTLVVQEEEKPNKEVEESVSVLKNAAKTRKVAPEEIISAFTKGLQSGKYFPITAVQRFDAAGKRIENGVYLGPLGWLTFEGRISWKKRILAFIFEKIKVKVGPFNPFEISFPGKDEREPSNKDPFFIWFYVDDEIAVARGRSGGTAFWVRAQRISTY
ncbi:hypothetical protein ACJIZ3_020842 [Penstemon smallii]|uniref:Uncharacterized protein n=1 Tax=Penstemon smallii TaxID=265156 RepID=A0ABD3SK13_9LAMI